MKINEKELEAVFKLPASKRYSYFIKKICDWEEVWTLYDDGFATISDDNGNILIPFWPNKRFAESCAKEEWSTYRAEMIGLDDFIEKWLPGMKNDAYKPAIIWNTYDSAVTSIDELLKDIKEELDNY
ncbi:DUF2750 domain-containing protein [Cytobacillus gottheilii]|uniref:DUF2750 domain-containing protein n=1 Tax=Cytobacillus gottheilii TaxID=859144 RepID=UPI002494FF8E|nr:DUF2750 domain-containing protein [Cytobacillus gottheilii]